MSKKVEPIIARPSTPWAKLSDQDIDTLAETLWVEIMIKKPTR